MITRRQRMSRARNWMLFILAGQQGQLKGAISNAHWNTRKEGDPMAFTTEEIAMIEKIIDDMKKLKEMIRKKNVDYFITKTENDHAEEI